MTNFKYGIVQDKFEIGEIKPSETQRKDLQWQAVKNMIRDGKAEIVIFEKSDEEFQRPGDLKQFGQWNTKLTFFS